MPAEGPATAADPLIMSGSPTPTPIPDHAGNAPGTLASRLGHAGLVPFVAGALLVWLVHDDLRAHAGFALAGYAALITSFLGGIHWGHAMRRPDAGAAALLWGVVPSLLAWPALLMPPASALIVTGGLLLACYGVDRRLYPAVGAAGWLTLRFRLSMVAALSCFVGAAGS